MSELALWIVRTGFLVVLWIFIFSIISVIRSDIFGQKVVNKVAEAKAPKVVSAPTVPNTMTGAIGGLAAATAPAAQQTTSSANATKLVITEGERTGHTLRLDRREITIGRSSDSDLVINDDYASTHHAKLVQVENDWVIQDLNSTNGTFVNNQRVSVPTPVPLYTPVSIGSTIFELRP